MADFNVNLAAPQASGTQVISPVHDARTNFPNPLVGFGLGLAEILVKNQAESKKAEKQAQEDAILAEFTRSQTAYNDYIVQGGDPAIAGSKARANFSKYAAAYPHLAEEMAKKNKALFEYTELGEAKESTQMFKDARKTLINDAVKSGYMIDETTPPQVVNSQLKAFQTVRKADEEFRRIVDARREMRAASAEDRAAFDFKSKQEATALLANIGDTHLDSSFKSVQAIVDEAKRTGDANTGKAKLLQLFSGIDRSLASAASLHPELAKSYKSLFDEVKQFGVEGLEGKLDITASENRLKELQNRIMITTLSSPENKAVYGASKLFGGTIPATYLEVNTIGKDLIGNLAHTFAIDSPTIVGKPAEERAMYDLIKGNVSGIENGRIPDAEGAKVQLGNLANNTLHQIGQAATRGMKPEQLTTAMNFLASPEYAKLVSYGKIDKDAASSAQKVFSVVYEQSVSKSIEQKLDEPFRYIKDNPQPYGSLVDFVWTGAGVTATMADKGKAPLIYKHSEMHARDVFVSEMSNATKALNQLIKVGAHMEGHTDYGKYWEENKHNILPNYFPDPARLKVGQVVTAKNGKKYKYLGGNYNNIEGSYVEVSDGGG